MSLEAEVPAASSREGDCMQGGGEGMESNHPRNVTPRNSVLKTGRATGPYPPPCVRIYMAFFTSERGGGKGVL